MWERTGLALASLRVAELGGSSIYHFPDQARPAHLRRCYETRRQTICLDASGQSWLGGLTVVVTGRDQKLTG